jgi:hypothetical protein
MARSRIVHRNPVDSINRRYFREVAKVKRQFPNMTMTRANYISKARRERREALRALGIRTAL